MEQIFDLQRFADGEGAGPAGDAAQAAAPDAGGQSPAQEQPGAPQDARPSFDELIRGEYKQEFDKRVHKILSERFKNARAAEEQLKQLEPAMRLLSDRYGVDPSDANGLLGAMERDDSWYRDEAAERGIPVAQLREMKRIQRENEGLKGQLHRREAEEYRRQSFLKTIRQAEQARELYPSLDLNQEMQSADFARLVASGVDVRTAYEVVHRDELTADAMQYSAKKAQQAVANAVQAGAARPEENGMGGAPAVVMKTDPSKLTQRDFEDIYARVRRGERITF